MQVRSVHWDRSPMPCMRWVVSIGGICKGISLDKKGESYDSPSFIAYYKTVASLISLQLTSALPIFHLF